MSFLALKKLLFKLGYDTRVRNTNVASALQPFVSRNELMLDAGSGEYGLGAFLQSANIIGTDMTYPSHQNSGQPFICADLTRLPFAQFSFPVAASVDVLEHLPPDARDKAIEELVRVSNGLVVVAFPHNKQAYEVDESFQIRLTEQNREAPSWLTEHLQNSYPQVESILSKIESESARYHNEIKEIKVSYSEHIKITRILRWAAGTSNYLYMFTNLIFGLLLPIIPRPDKDNSYRAIVLVQFNRGLTADAA